MSRFVKIPVHVLESKISASAKLLWIELARVSSPKRPTVWPNPEIFAEKMRLSVRTIRRLVGELVKAGLLTHHGYIQKRQKTYDLVWTSVAKASAYAKATADKLADKPTSDLTPEVLDNWNKRFPCLDGLSGRPTLIQVVQQAVQEAEQTKTKDARGYIEVSLKNMSRFWSESYHREKFDLVRQFGLSP